MIYQGSIYVPLRKISELLGAEVTWDGQNRTVNIDTMSVDVLHDLRNAHSSAVYQYLSLERNLVLKDMEKSLKKVDLKGLERAVSEFERLADVAGKIKNTELEGHFVKMATAAELIRSGLASDNFDEYYLAWTLFESSATQANAIIQRVLEDTAKATR